MRIHNARIAVIVACVGFVLCAGTGFAQSDQVPQLKTYNFGDIGSTRYDIVRRLPVDTWRSALRLPTYPTEGDAMAALNAEAVHLGADGLLNVFCLDQHRGKLSWSKEPAFLCYGVAIRVRTSQG